MKHVIMKGHKLTRKVKVDNEDYQYLNQFKWLYSNGYSRTMIDGKNVSMHRLIMKPKGKEIIDHINHDELDNRKENLRICDRFVNMQNRRKGRGCIKKLPVNNYIYWYGEVRQNLKRYRTTTCPSEEQAKGALKQLLKEMKL